MLTRLKIFGYRAKGHQGFRRYLANTSWMLAEQALRMVAGLLVGVWVARYLGPEQFGVFSYAVAFVALFASFAKLGLDSIVIRDLVQDPGRRDRYLGTAFWLKLFGALGMLGMIAIVIEFTSNDATTKLYIYIIAGGVIFQAFDVVDFYFQSRVLSKFVSICKLTQLLISSLLKLYLILAGAELFWFVLLTLLDQFTLAISLIFAYRYQKIGGFYCYFDWAITRRLLKDSWPLIASGIVIMVYSRIDQIMIKGMLGERDVGLYAAAVRLSEVFYFIPLIITNSLFPAIVSAREASIKLYYLRMQRLYTFLVWSAIAIAVPLYLFSDWLVIHLFGVAYQEAGKVLMINVWAGIFVFYGCARGRWLVTENIQRYGLICTAIGAITNILLNLVLIEKMGIAGAAVATVVSYGVSSVVVPLFFYEDRVSVVMFFKAFSLSNLRA